MTRSFTFLVNPAAGGGAAPEAVVPVARVLRQAGASVEVTYSPGPRAVRALATAAVERGDVVVSVGGDGMLSSLVGLVSGLGGTLGIVPAGRGNDFARMLGLPTSPAQRASLLLEASPRKVDLLSVGDRLVAGSVYAGVDARAATIVDRARRVPRSLEYPLAAVRAIASYRPGRYRIDVDGTGHEFSAATVVVANSAYYGNGMKIAPGAGLDNGLLDVVVVEAASRVALLRALPSLYDGSHVDRPEVTVLRGRRVELSGRASGPIHVGADGEPLDDLPAFTDRPLVAEVVPGALSVLA